MSTPVGYKCRECARQLPSARRTVKPRQLALAIVVSLAVGVGGAFALAALGLFFWLGALLLGIITAEAARRASGGHRTAAIAASAGAGVLIGTFVAGLGFIAMLVGTAAAVVNVMSNRW
ncbi:MAG TPA: hypothetical protein VLQ52_03975 [Coriobacteriia bacterium]|nr:hypothetical protein [Coriobacteriia bacterium]